METVYYEFRPYNFLEGYIRFDLDKISKEKINNYMNILHLCNSTTKYKICEKPSVNCTWHLNDYSFIKPQVLFRNHKMFLEIVSIFGEDIKYILKSWMRHMGQSPNSEYYYSWINCIENIDKFIEEATIKSIIE